MFHATVTGNLGRDPEFQTTQSGQMVSKFSLAIRQAKKDAPPFWVKVEVWGKQSEYVANYLKKGASVCVSGQITEESWNHKTTGELKKVLVIKNASVESWQARGDQPAAPAAPAPAPVQQVSNYADDDIPF